MDDKLNMKLLIYEANIISHITRNITLVRISTGEHNIPYHVAKYDNNNGNDKVLERRLKKYCEILNLIESEDK